MKMVGSLIYCFVVCICLCQCLAFPVDYNNTAVPVKGKLNVHLVPHSHDDLGWLKTVDQYFVGSNSSIQVAAVQYILDSVVSALQEDPNKKFIYVETGFFARWWRQQNEKKKEIVRKLVASGQLEFINGGWVMHDEATVMYVDMIDQTSLGHRFLMKEFGVLPVTGWQIDPFGHSAVQAYLLCAEVGFSSLFFGRADYQDIANRRNRRTMETIWRGSKTLGASAQVFTGILPNLYVPPDGFDLGIATTEAVVQDDPFLYDYNLEERVNSFVKSARDQAKQYRTNHIIWTMGEDFAYESAGTWFKQMDKLIHYVNKDGRVNAFYSTPTIYTREKYMSNEIWPLKTDDFFPYADHSNAYWTGYFTSRPALKGYVRKLSGFLQAAKQLEFLVGRNKRKPNTYSLEEAMAIVQHHDAVVGTSKQHVANDYAARLSHGSLEAENVMSSALVCLMNGKSSNFCGDKISSEQRAQTEPKKENLFEEIDSESISRDKIELEQCPLMNISYCPKSEANLDTGRSLAIVLYNPLGWKRNEVIKIPVTNTTLEVLDSIGNKIQTQIVPVDPATRRVRNFYTQDMSVQAGPLFNLYFEASVPPLGYSVYFLKAAKNGASAAGTLSMKPGHINGEIIVDSTRIQLAFSKSTGLLKEIRNHHNNAVFPINQSLCWYNSSDGNTRKGTYEASGAYIFRPNISRCFPIEDSKKQVIQSVTKGNVVSEVYQQFSPWASQVVRLYKNAEDVEIDFLIGPIPIDDDLGKEVVSQFRTNMVSNKEFYTDSNGRDFLKRIRNYRADWNLSVHEIIAGNYYPLNLGIYLKDNDTEFSLLVDRSVGGSSVSDGELELMLHRRLLHDDNKGVAENLNETVCFDNNKTCEGLTDEIKIKEPQFSALAKGYELPPNVAIITLQELEDGQTLLRLAHLYEASENVKLSVPATVDIHNLFPGRKIKKIVELNLSGVQEKSKIKTLNWKVEGDTGSSAGAPRRDALKDGEHIVELSPMEIRTFNLDFDV
ncbi:alpha-mannosidase isoform X2 [Cryptomeria japonica]|uniref:alpha-mannosidase isoform X2 n=1 Tax=Cryptomeria japonica TaxID=3369 RepID=UPI0027D9DBA8|nr:alpha-mannosidase isoform X2 [Cryptomeria japonica]